jgi:hypothetical protein
MTLLDELDDRELIKPAAMKKARKRPSKWRKSPAPDGDIRAGLLVGL